MSVFCIFEFSIVQLNYQAHQLPVPIRTRTFLGNAHAEAADTTVKVRRRQVESILLTCVTIGTINVQLKSFEITCSEVTI